MSKFAGHKYTWTKPFGNVRHMWQLRGPEGAIHFHVTVMDEQYGDSAGLEMHYTTPPDYMKGHAPHYIDCPFVGGRCWHDGTSLYASEHLWPMIKSFLMSGDHDMIFKTLEREYVDRFEFVDNDDD